MTKTEKFKKFIVCVLLVISFLLTFTGWVRLKGIDYPELKDDASESLGDVAEEIADYLDVDERVTLRMIESVNDLKLSPSELKLFTSNNSYLKSVLKELNYYGYESTYTNIFKKISNFFTFYNIMYFLNIVAVLFTLFVVISGKYPKCDWFYTLTLGIIFIVFIVLSSKLNDLLNLGNSLIGFDDDLIGARFGITLLSVISLLFALPSRLYYGVLDKFNINKGAEAFDNITSNISGKAGGIGLGKILSSKGSSNVWTCPNCGEKNEKTSKFCVKCGSKNPHIMICPTCNRELSNREAFCPGCGTKIEWPLIALYCPECGNVNLLSAKFCEKCGTSLKKKEEPVLEETNQEEA